MVIGRISEVFSSNNRHNNGQSKRNGGKTSVKKEEGCTPCRLVGGSGLAILGVYMIMQGRSATGSTPSKARIHAALTCLIGLIFTGLGVTRLLGLEMPESKG